MHLIFLHVLMAIAAATASPLHHATMMRRDLSSAPGIDTIAQNFKAFLSDSIPSEPIGNTAVWEEAIANDAKASKGPANQLFSQSIAHVQKYEIASDISNATTLSQSSSAARVLQFLQLYPTRFQQAQAANPAEVIGEYQCGDIMPVH